MIQFISTIAILLWASVAWGGMQVPRKPIAAAAANYSDIIFYWSCDSETANKVPSGADSSADPDGAAAIDTIYQVGTGSCDFPSAYSRYEFTLNNDDLVDTDSGRVGMWVYVTTAGNATPFFTAYYSSTNYISVFPFGTNSIRFDYQAGGSGPSYVGTSNNAYTLNTWFFLEFAWNKGGAGNDFQMWINGSSVATDDTASGTWTKSATGLLIIGDNAGNTTDFHLDNIIISNDPTRNLYAEEIRNGTSF